MRTKKVKFTHDIIELAVLMNHIYTTEPAGGALHIVLGDGNTEDEHIKWCIDNSIAELVGTEHDAYLRCAELLLQMTEPERLDAIAFFFGISRKWGHAL